MKNIVNKQEYDEQRLQADIDELEKEITPQRDLWSGIEKAIVENNKQQSTVFEKKSLVLSPTSWAASIVVAVLLTWGLLPKEQIQPVNSLSLVAAMQADFNHQKQTMLVSFGTPNINELPAAMQTELTKLASAQATISKALDDDPNNTDLLNLLRWTQKQELDLLTQLYSPQWQTI